ncbi:MAG: carboxypeptidase-like regulatory domain-containing protein [Proteobacteria bacterium]|nr:carboxypeptidase-like regulatory domain-containing protein [Pseudomonadota bacterium]
MKPSVLLLNRFTLTFAAIGLVALAWNLYVAANDDGHLSGRVVAADGAPVAGATVVLSRKTVTAVERVADTVTDSAGRFAFEHHGQYAVVLGARKSGIGSAPRRTVRLWFRDQNRDLAEPLVLSP